MATDGPIAKYHEFGTSRIPARPFLGGALMQQEAKIPRVVARTISAALSSGGPNYRELRELLHLAHGLYEEGKSSTRTRTRDDGAVIAKEHEIGDGVLAEVKKIFEK